MKVFELEFIRETEDNESIRFRSEFEPSPQMIPKIGYALGFSFDINYEGYIINELSEKIPTLDEILNKKTP